MHDDLSDRAALHARALIVAGLFAMAFAGVLWGMS